MKKRLPQCPECKSTEILYRQTVDEYWTIAEVYKGGSLDLNDHVDSVITGEHHYLCNGCTAEFDSLKELNLYKKEEVDKTKSLFKKQMKMIKNLIERHL